MRRRSASIRPEDTPTVQTSLELLAELLEEGTSYKTPAHILGVTAYLEAMAEAQPLFQEHTWGLLQFDESMSDWATPICNAVEFIRRRAKQPITVEYDVDVCVLTALSDPEMKAIYRLNWDWMPPAPLDDSIFVRNPKLRFATLLRDTIKPGRQGRVLLKAVKSAAISSQLPPRDS
jgi:hypothetical protein